MKLRLTLKSRDEEIGEILTSMAKGDEHIVRLKIDTTLHGPMAAQYKLLRLIKNAGDEKKFIESLLSIGISMASRTFLRNILTAKIFNISLFNQLFKKEKKKWWMM